MNIYISKMMRLILKDYEFITDINFFYYKSLIQRG
jgi:hypothetical protein